MYCKYKLFFLLFFILLQVGCNNNDNENQPLDGGPCEYNEFEGIAIITSVTDASEDDYIYNCSNDPVQVTFDFYPDDPNAINEYRFSDEPTETHYLTVGVGANPSRNYMIMKGIYTGSSHKSTRSEIISGTCSPVGYTFTEIDFSDYADYCWD